MIVRAATVLLLSVSVFAGSGARALEVDLPTHERVELPNGAVLILSEKRDVPLVGLEAIVRGGAVTDPDSGQTVWGERALHVDCPEFANRWPSEAN